MAINNFNYCDEDILTGYETIKKGNYEISRTFKEFTRDDIEKMLNKYANCGFNIINGYSLEAYRIITTRTTTYTDGTSTSSSSESTLRFDGEIYLGTPYNEKEMKKIVMASDTLARSNEELEKMEKALVFKTRQEKGKVIGGAAKAFIVVFVLSIILTLVSFYFLTNTADGKIVIDEVVAAFKKTLETQQSTEIDIQTLPMMGVVYLTGLVGGLMLFVVFGILSIVKITKDKKHFKNYNSEYIEMTSEDINDEINDLRNKILEASAILPYFAKQENKGKYFTIPGSFWDKDQLEIINNETNDKTIIHFNFRK